MNDLKAASRQHQNMAHASLAKYHQELLPFEC